MRKKERTLPRTAIGAALVAAGALTACDKPIALGDVNQILVASPAPYWQQLESDIKGAMEPQTFTVRNERVFDLAHADPMDEGWSNLRLLKQILLIGTPEDPAVAQALDEYRGTPPTPPAVFQIRNVWASNQLVTVALLPSGSGEAALKPLLPQLGEIYLSQYEEYAHARMFVTRPNEILADSLRRTAGFTVTVPNVYRTGEVEPGIWQFRNDQPDPSKLIRNLTVDSRAKGEVDFTAEEALAWRAELFGRLEQPPQVTEAFEQTMPLKAGNHDAIQIQGVWSNPPGQWPAAGPYLTRLVDCGDRLMLVDTWLYAPGDSKFEYMYQINTILDSFECVG